MRMRRKRHLDERLNNAKRLLFVEGDDFFFRKEEDRYHIVNVEEIFGNANPVELEVGCGKGGFIIEKAKRNPDVNYIAAEKISNVLVSALENAEKVGVDNVRFLNCDARNLNYYFDSPFAGRIYLNFSTPYPQKGSAGKRLSNPRFIEVYDKLLLPGGEVIMKTDNAPLFEYSIESFSSCGYLIKNVTTNLHASPLSADNVVTEYEKSFTDKGLPIFSFTAVKRA